MACSSYLAGLDPVLPHLRARASGSERSFKPGNVHARRYIYVEDLLKLDECSELSCPVQWPVGPSPVHLMSYYIVILIFSAGFRIGYSRQAPSLKIILQKPPPSRRELQSWLATTPGQSWE